MHSDEEASLGPLPGAPPGVALGGEPCKYAAGRQWARFRLICWGGGEGICLFQNFFFFFFHWKRKTWLPVEAEIFRGTTRSAVGGWHLEKTRQSVPWFPV